MGDKTIKKVSSKTSPQGDWGERYLVSGKASSMRLWEQVPAGAKPEEEHARPYETLGYVLEGQAELHIEDQVVMLEAGDSWLVPKNARHFYRILEPFTAIESTAPPAQVHGRDQ